MTWTRRFIFVDPPRHYKFWQITVAGETCYIDYGKIGTNGSRQVKSFPYPEEAEKFATIRIKEKLKKGYTEVHSVSPNNLQPPDPFGVPVSRGNPSSHIKHQRRLDV